MCGGFVSECMGLGKSGTKWECWSKNEDGRTMTQEAHAWMQKSLSKCGSEIADERAWDSHSVPSALVAAWFFLFHLLPPLWWFLKIITLMSHWTIYQSFRSLSCLWKLRKARVSEVLVSPWGDFIVAYVRSPFRRGAACFSWVACLTVKEVLSVTNLAMCFMSRVLL